MCVRACARVCVCLGLRDLETSTIKGPTRLELSRHRRKKKENESKRRPFKWDFTFGNKNNQQVLNLANTESGRVQSLFVGPKTS